MLNKNSFHKKKKVGLHCVISNLYENNKTRILSNMLAAIFQRTISILVFSSAENVHYKTADAFYFIFDAFKWEQSNLEVEGSNKGEKSIYFVLRCKKCSNFFADIVVQYNSHIMYYYQTFRLIVCVQRYYSTL